MNDLQIFNSKEFGEVRTVLVDNEPMFCLVDICRALDISNPSKVAQRLDEDERTKLELGRQGETNFISLILQGCYQSQLLPYAISFCSHKI